MDVGVKGFRIDITDLEDAKKLLELNMLDFIGFEALRTSKTLDFFNTGEHALESVLGGKMFAEMVSRGGEISEAAKEEGERYIGRSFPDDIAIYSQSLGRATAILERLIGIYGEKSLLLPL